MRAQLVACDPLIKIRPVLLPDSEDVTEACKCAFAIATNIPARGHTAWDPLKVLAYVMLFVFPRG